MFIRQNLRRSSPLKEKSYGSFPPSLLCGLLPLFLGLHIRSAPDGFTHPHERYPPDGELANPAVIDIQPDDLLITEILSNPKPNGVDFLELYNHSTKSIDLQGVYLAAVNANGAVGSRRKVANRPTIIHPNEYRVLTTNPVIVKAHYPLSATQAFIEMPTLPNFNNETGGVVLYAAGMTIDSLFFTPAMWSPFIADHKGISLERQRLSAPTNMPGNFRSAATAVGGATPGYANSQSLVETAPYGFFLASRTFSPDQDGFEDELTIAYHLPESDWMANIEIYNDSGRLVRKLHRNQRMATEGTVTWDGLSDAQQPLPIGIYIAMIEIYHPKGLKKQYRLGFVLAARL